MATTTAPPAPAGRPGLKRQIGFIGLIWASTGSIIGSGWLFGSQHALEAAGPSAIISWAIGGVAILVLALVHAELGGMFPIAGGTARFPHIAFGGVAGASFGWFSWLQAATVAPIEVEAMITYAQHWTFAHAWLHQVNHQAVLTGSGIAVAIVLMAILTLVNLFSVKILANTNSAATWWKVGIPVLTIIVLAFSGFHGSNFAAANGFAPEGAKGILAAVSTSGIIFSLLGFEQADQLAGESTNPKRDIPRAVIGSVVIGLVIYLLLQIFFLGALRPEDIRGTWAGAAYTTFTGPFADIAMGAGIVWLAVVIYIDAIVSPAGTGLIYVTASSRVSYGLSKNGYFPKAFEWVTRAGVPWVGLVAAFVIGIVCFLPFPSWQSLVGLITSASVLMYAGAPLAVGAFRKRIPEVERPYRLPAAHILSPVAFIISNLIILWSGWETDWKLGIAVAIGFVLIVLNRVLGGSKEVQPRWDWKAAQWLFPYLIGIGLIVYFSDFNTTSPSITLFPLWWDIVAVAVFSLIIYYWAVNVASSREEILRTANEVVETEEAGIVEPVAH
ncbi:APC family permease [Curtobacterium sp. Leaf261]|uniref:APC family permease n=1 Tax=Curtobacterium sp. Leaf261 TaxID=1736311 RepID=UPI0006FDA214|nr:APC family permease [Curtobacterium sp. Leaf261]KQO60239.1 amino acid permease [Curtobacterium sp. Leaf261]